MFKRLKNMHLNRNKTKKKLLSGLCRCLQQVLQWDVVHHLIVIPIRIRAQLAVIIKSKHSNRHNKRHSNSNKRQQIHKLIPMYRLARTIALVIRTHVGVRDRHAEMQFDAEEFLRWHFIWRRITIAKKIYQKNIPFSVYLYFPFDTAIWCVSLFLSPHIFLIINFPIYALFVSSFFFFGFFDWFFFVSFIWRVLGCIFFDLTIHDGNRAITCFVFFFALNCSKWTLPKNFKFLF